MLRRRSTPARRWTSLPRLMAVALTLPAVHARRKTVTRRLGWAFIREGDVIDLVEKSMGRRHGEPVVYVARVRIVSVRRERLNAITDAEVDREGFGPYGDPHPHQEWWPPGSVPPAEVHGPAAAAFVDFFTASMRCHAETLVTRIEWEYLEPETVQETLL